MSIDSKNEIIPWKNITNLVDEQGFTDYTRYESIPKDVLNLLWFSDGRYRNFNINNKSNDNKGFRITYRYNNNTPLVVNNEVQQSPNNILEPSLISIKYPIGTSIDPLEDVGYWPIYYSMSPNQRATYLDWLTDITRPVNISYVFLFFYGLERFLYMTDKFSEAFNMIRKLRMYHKHPSFMKYSSESLMGAAIYRNRYDLIREILEEEDLNLNAVVLGAMTILEMTLSSEQIISLNRKVGFTNNLYIKRDYEFFNKILKNVLRKKYGTDVFPLRKIFLEDAEIKHILSAANCTLREVSVKQKNIFYSKIFKEEIFALLYETHQEFKKTYRMYKMGLV